MKKTLLVVVMVLIIISVAGCSKTPQEVVYDALGKWKGKDDSGVSKIILNDDTVEIQYCLFPLGMLVSADEEIGVDLAAGIKKIYSKLDDISNMKVTVYFPYDDSYGARTWKEYVSFEASRNLIERKINWDNFSRRDFIKVVEGLQRYR